MSDPGWVLIDDYGPIMASAPEVGEGALVVVLPVPAVMRGDPGTDSRNSLENPTAKTPRRQEAKTSEPRNTGNGNDMAKKRVTTAVQGTTIQRVPINRIKPAAYNPRKHLRPSDPEYQRIKRSISTFGLVDPLVWNKRTGNLVGGHQRLNILRDEFGAAEVDVSVVNLDDAQEKALNLALNKVAGSWDEPALAEMLKELQDEIDLAETGFSRAEIDELLDAARPQAEGEPPAGPGLVYRVVVDCRNEQQQRELLGRLSAEGLNCRATIS